jgi:hypothetical protein
MLLNMIGLTSTVQPTLMAHLVMPKRFSCARIYDGKISVGMRKALVPHVAA